MKKFFLFIWSVGMIFFTGCEKDELTLPVEVNFEFAMDSYNSENNPKGGQAFKIDEGTVVINTIEFDGRRDQGEDYFFTSSFDTPVQAEMHTGQANQDISFDIPQGVYKRIELTFSMGNKAQAMCIKGKFQRGPFEEIPVRFEYNFQEQIRVRAKNMIGNEQIVLKKSEPSVATVLLDAPFLFRLVNVGMIQAAEHSQIEGSDAILINNEINTEIFNLLVTRLDNSMRVIFE